MKGRAVYIRPTSLLMPVGYKNRKVLYLHEFWCKKYVHEMPVSGRLLRSGAPLVWFR